MDDPNSVTNIKIGLGGNTSRLCAALVQRALTEQDRSPISQQIVRLYRDSLSEKEVPVARINELLAVMKGGTLALPEGNRNQETEHCEAVMNAFKQGTKLAFGLLLPEILESAVQAVEVAEHRMDPVRFCAIADKATTSAGCSVSYPGSWYSSRLGCRRQKRAREEEVETLSS